MTRIDLPTASGPCTEVPFEKCPDLTWRVSFANFKRGSEGQAPATILSGNQAGKHHLPTFFLWCQYRQTPSFFFFFPLSFPFSSLLRGCHVMLSSAMHRALQQLLHTSGALSFTSTEPGFPAADVMRLGPQAPQQAGWEGYVPDVLWL